MEPKFTVTGVGGQPGPETLVLSLPNGTEVLRLEAAGERYGVPVIVAYVSRDVEACGPVAVGEALTIWHRAWSSPSSFPHLIAAAQAYQDRQHRSARGDLAHLTPAEHAHERDVLEAAIVNAALDLLPLTQAEIDAVLPDPAVDPTMRPRSGGA